MNLFEKMKFKTLSSYCVFRQKIGDVFHFEILCINEDCTTPIPVGYVLINGKTGALASSLVSFIQLENKKMEELALEEFNNIKNLFEE